MYCGYCSTGTLTSGVRALLWVPARQDMVGPLPLKSLVMDVMAGATCLQGGLDAFHALSAAEVAEEGMLDRMVHQGRGEAPRSCEQCVSIVHQRLYGASFEYCQGLQQLPRALGLSTPQPQEKGT